MIKTIEYAYATSTMAKRMKRAAVGCYYVALHRSVLDPEPLAVYGPYSSIADAEAKAARFSLPFSRYSKRDLAQ